MEDELCVYYLDIAQNIVCPGCMDDYGLDRNKFERRTNDLGLELWCSICQEPIAYVGQTIPVRSDWKSLQFGLGV